jgi:antitoxin VapB
MALNIKDSVTEDLASEVAALTGDTKTGAVRAALRDTLERLRAAADTTNREARVRRFLRDEAWPQLPFEVRGRPLSKAERDAALGYGPDGV